MNKEKVGKKELTISPETSKSKPAWKNKDKLGANNKNVAKNFAKKSSTSTNKSDKSTEGEKPEWKKRGRANKKPLTLTIKPGQGEKWYSHRIENEKDVVEDVKPISKEEFTAFQKRAESLLEKDSTAYAAHCTEGDGRSDYLWMNKIMKTGTLPDRMAAFTVRIQDSPVHGLHALQQLIVMVKPQGKQQCLMVSDTVRDLFLEDLLPPKQKLRTFESRSSNLQGATEKQLILWIFEDRLKTQYSSFIEALRRMTSDQIEKLRGKGISIIEQLLSSHPEREDLLLQILVNKLGDPLKKVGSRALFHLNKVLEKHPQMKLIFVSEVERLLFRNNVSSRARYYSICFLNGLRLNTNETTLAAKLVTVYLAFFKGCVKTGEIDGKMMGGLLTGVNRSFPIAKLIGFEFTESLDVLFKIVQLSQFSIGVQALSLIFQITDNTAAGTDRFYRVLYRKLLDPEIATTSHGVQFLNLIFKAMKRDTVANRVKGFAKRLLQVCGNSPPNMVCAMMFLISEVQRTHKTILSVGEVDQKDVKVAPVSEAVEDFEQSDSRKGKFRKKSNNKQVNLDHLMKTTNVQFGEESTPAENQIENGADALKTPLVDLDESVVEIKDEVDTKFLVKDYDPLARNPSFCGAEKTLAFELIPLSRHFHPSVALFAKTLLSHGYISYDGNPLKDFTVGRFLERFVYRNAKTNSTRPEYQPEGLRAVPVNSSSYLQADENKIPVEEKFFYKYFKDAKEKLKPVKQEDDEDVDVDSDAESVGDEEFDDLMGNYFKNNGAVMSDDDEEDVDFMSNVKKMRKKGKKKNRNEDEESEEESDAGSGEEAEDGSLDEISGDDDADELIEMDSEEEPEFDAEDGDLDDDEDDGAGLGDLSDDEDFDGTEFGELKSQLNLQGTRKNKLKSIKGGGVFAPAEQFSEMLESNANTGFTGSHTLINADNADMKQMKWEENRDRWAKGYKRTGKVQFKGHAKKRKFK